MFLSPGDLGWQADGTGLAATVARVIDRMQARRVIAMSEGGRLLELDVSPQTVIRAGDRGHVAIRDAKVFAAG